MALGRPRVRIDHICQNPLCLKPFSTKPSKNSQFCSRACWYAFYSSRSPEERFWTFVDQSPGHGPQGECWLWTGGKDKYGYGHFNVTSKPLVQMSAYRYSWELANGPVLGGLFVLHRCDFPSCVNPTHLFLGTQQDNIADAWQKGRMRPTGAPGASNSHAKLTIPQVYEIRALQGILPSIEVAGKYHVTLSAVNRIWTRKAWSSLDEL